MFCSKCGTKFDDEEQLFCINCGAKRPGIKVPVATMVQESRENPVNNSNENAQVNNVTLDKEQPQVNNVTSTEEQLQVNNISSNEEQPQVSNVTSNEEQLQDNNVTSTEEQPQINSVTLNKEQSLSTTGTSNQQQATNATPNEEQSQNGYVTATLGQTMNQYTSSNSTTSQSVTLNKPEFVLEKPAIPSGFVLDPASGWFYKSNAKQLPNGAYVNEITWFEPSTGKTAVKEYPMSELQVRSMYGQNGHNTQMNQQMNYAQQNTYQQQSVSQIQPKKKKTGLIIGIIAAIVVLIVLGICAWKFDWIKFGKDDEISSGINVTVTVTQPPQTITPTPTPTEAPMNRLGVLNEDYIVVGNEEIVTTQEKLYFEYMGLTNEDLESLKYMKNLEYLDIKGNNITSLDFIKNIDTLTYLDASENDIYDINALEGLVNLESLELNHTKISDLTPLQNLKSLTSLNVTNTDVFDLTPLISNELLLYLYVADTKVEDFSCLLELPNLYYCDAYDVSSTITPTPIPQFDDEFIFTEGDYEYLIPATENYAIINVNPPYYDQLILVSYDEYGTCVQIRFRMDVGMEIIDEELDDYVSSFKEEFGATNFNSDGSIIYFDYPTTSEEFAISKEQLIKDLEADGCEVLINENYYE